MGRALLQDRSQERRVLSERVIAKRLRVQDLGDPGGNEGLQSGE